VLPDFEGRMQGIISDLMRRALDRHLPFPWHIVARDNTGALSCEMSFKGPPNPFQFGGLRPDAIEPPWNVELTASDGRKIQDRLNNSS
jgi:hypothetical protein